LSTCACEMACGDDLSVLFKEQLLRPAIGVLALAVISGALVVQRLAGRTMDSVRELATPRSGDIIHAHRLVSPVQDGLYIIVHDDAHLPWLVNTIRLRTRIDQREPMGLHATINESSRWRGLYLSANRTEMSVLP
jgi:hypothetical protein